MKFCGNCGIQLEDNDKICSNCGAAQDVYEATVAKKEAIKPKKEENFPKEDKGGFGWWLLGFLIPLLGIILFFVWKKSKPKRAKSLGVGAIVGIVSTVLFWIIFILCIAVLASMM